MRVRYRLRRARGHASPLDGPAPAADAGLPGGPGGSHPHAFAERVERLAAALERSNISDYVTLLQSPWRLLWVNFVAGAARGIGIGIGFAVLSTVLLYILRHLMMANLPVIGDLIATIVRLVEQQLRP